MALNVALLQSGLTDVAANPPATTAECAQAWADAVGDFATAIVPASSTVEAAAAALSASLLAAFESGDAAAPMEVAFLTFATAVGGGMVGFVATPPPAPVGFAEEFAGPFPTTHAEAGQSMAQLIFDWMLTGTATPSGGGAPVNWT
jgi:hypothetical protein